MKNSIKKSRPAGFALIVTLSLMILLTVIAVGLLGLSSISLRSATQGSALNTARSNARLGMMLALGELQVALGTDQSVSAPASAVVASAKRPRLTGAWQSWHWAPTANASPPFTDKAALFNRWLVSTANPADARTFALASGNEPAGGNSVALVGGATTALTDSQGLATKVSAEKIKVGSASRIGKYAWAVFDESTKAAIDLGDPDTPQVAGSEIASRTVPSRFRADWLDPKLVSLKTPSHLISTETATIPGGVANLSEFRRRFHDFTTGTMGLLTNPSMGGLKTDLTSLFEPAAQPAGAFMAPTAVTPYPAAFGIAYGAPKWSYLRDHYRKYKTTKNDASGESSYTLSSTTDLKINASAPIGTTPSPDNERLLPVLAKFQMVFSLVSHHALNVGNRVAFLETSGQPKGSANYAVIHLAYDPVITLYNPYDVTLNLTKTRIRVWDPPVGFRFTKIDNARGTKALFRPNPKSGEEFLGLARFQYTKEQDPEARKCFTLVLADGTDSAASGALKLKPGEVKVFSPRVQPTWNWGWETAGGYNVKAFFDFAQGNNFGNVDFRTATALGKWGVECVPGWQSRAGLQTDHLATIVRDLTTLYPFEIINGKQSADVGGFVSMRLTDDVVVEAMPRVSAGAAAKQFQVDILAGLVEGSSALNVAADTSNLGVKEDTLRSYSFNFSDPVAEISADPANPIINHQFTVGNILQKPTETGPGGKKPFAMLELSARPTKDLLTDSKPWLYNNFVVEGAEQKTASVGLAHQGYDLRFSEISSFNNFPDGIAVDPDTKRGYFGASGSASEGSSFVSMLHIPTAPAASLGDFVPTNMVSSSLLPRVVHPFGNSRAHPLIPASSIATDTGVKMLDHSYLINDALWDSYYFSTLTSYIAGSANAGGVMPETLPLKSVLTGVLDGTKPALNSRLSPISAEGDPAETAAKVAALTDLVRSRQLAKYFGVQGPFNVNSTSIDAWQAVLSSLRDREVNGLEIQGVTGATLAKKIYSNPALTPFVRTGKPLAGSTPPGALRWAGYRALTDRQIKELAVLIVAEIVARGVKDSAPSLTLGEFVNRRPGSTLQSLAGLLQTAIDKSTVNAEAIASDSKSLSATAIAVRRKTGTQTPEVMEGQSVEGAPSMLTQGDLMAALAPIATVRGDTFKIRCYGEATAADGVTVTARAWCEAVVQRVPQFVDPLDEPEAAWTSLQSNTNKVFGRRFHLVSFRWLNQEEI